MVTNQQTIRALFRIRNDRAGNLPPLPGIFPDQQAPIVRVGTDGERELVMARWGMPSPPATSSKLFLKERVEHRGPLAFEVSFLLEAPFK